METPLPDFRTFDRLARRLDSSLEEILRRSLRHRRWLGFIVRKLRDGAGRTTLLDLFHKHAPEMKFVDKREYPRFTTSETPTAQDAVDRQLDWIEVGTLHSLTLICRIDGRIVDLKACKWSSVQLIRLANVPGSVVPSGLYPQYLQHRLYSTLASMEPIDVSRLIRHIDSSRDEINLCVLDLLPRSSLPTVRNPFTPSTCNALFVPLTDWLMGQDLLNLYSSLAYAHFPEAVDHLFTYKVVTKLLQKALSKRLDRIERSATYDDGPGRDPSVTDFERRSHHDFAKRGCEEVRLVLTWIQKHVDVADLHRRVETIHSRL